MKLTDEQIKELCDKATEGPWQAYEEGDMFSGTGWLVADFVAYATDREFIAAARELVPMLLDRAQRAEARLVEEEVTNEALLADAGIRNGVLERRIDRLFDVIHDDCECESFEVCSNHVSGADCATGYDCKKCWRAWLEQEVQI